MLFISGRDVVTVNFYKQLNDGTVVICSKSVEHESYPEYKSHTRATLHVFKLTFVYFFKNI